MKGIIIDWSKPLDLTHPFIQAGQQLMDTWKDVRVTISDVKRREEHDVHLTQLFLKGISHQNCNDEFREKVQSCIEARTTHARPFVEMVELVLDITTNYMSKISSARSFYSPVKLASKKKREK